VDYNFKDTTSHFNSVVAQLYFRQAMQHLEDQAGQILAFFNGAADPAYGPIPVYPHSPFLPSSAATNPYPFSVRDAISLLKAHGWNVTPNGTDTCAKPGTGPGECGAGITARTKLSFNLIYNTVTPVSQQAQDLASDAKQAGIKLNLSGSNFNFMIENYNAAGAVAAGRRLCVGVEVEHLGYHPDGHREPDPVRRHPAVLVPDQVADWPVVIVSVQLSAAGRGTGTGSARPGPGHRRTGRPQARQ